MEIQLHELTNPETIITCANGLTGPVANFNKVWFKLDKDSNEIWEVYAVGTNTAFLDADYKLRLPYTIRKFSKGVPYYKIAYADTKVWVQ